MSDDFPTGKDPFKSCKKDSETYGKDPLGPYKKEDKKKNMDYPLGGYSFVSEPHNTLMESFRWFSDDWKSQDVSKDKVRLKIVSVKAGDISKNGKKYVEEALLKSTNTWVGKPFIVNHDTHKIIGNIELTDFEDGQLEHIVVVNKQPWVDLIRSNSKEIKGVSIGAGYLFNKCVKCGKMFDSEEAWRTHMDTDHFIKDLPKEPHGIIGQDLSLVFGEEIPGLNTEISIMETVNNFGKLQETLLQERGIAIRPGPTQIGASRSGLLIAEPCSPELRACVDGLIADGVEEERAWAICRAKIGEITPSIDAQIKLLENAPSPYREAFVAVVGVWDSNHKELTDRISELEKQTKEQKVSETATVTTLQETLNAQKQELEQLRPLKEQLAKETVRADNAEHSLKGQFKGRHKSLTASEDDIPTSKDPLAPQKK